MSGLDKKRLCILCDPEIIDKDVNLESWIYNIHQNEGINVQNRDISIVNDGSRRTYFYQDGWTMGILLYIIAVIMVIEFKLFEFQEYPVPDNINEWIKH